MIIKVNKSREEIFPDMFNELNLIKGVEIGVFQGDFSKHLLNNWGGTLYLVDAWRGMDGYEDTSTSDSD